MGDKTGINWTDATWNPIVGCSVVSPGCKNCYAMREARRLEAMGVTKYVGLTDVVNGKAVFNGTVRLVEGALDQPLRWSRPRRIFVNSMSDLGHEVLRRGDVFQVLEAMEHADRHVFQVLTKRPEVLFAHLCAYHPAKGTEPAHMAFNHVWWGVSVEDQARADERLADARRMDEAGYRVWVSYEPAIGPVDWTGWEFIAGMVSGGESGPNARPSHPDWHRHTDYWCAKHGIPYDFKQWGEWAPGDCAAGLSTRAKTAAHYGSRRWFYSDLTAREQAEMHCEDEPDVYRLGRKAAGRTLDGAVHDGFTRVCAPAGSV